MKTHAIIPIFIPHSGCPHDCVFCNQKAITARSAAPSPEETKAVIDRNLETITRNANIKTVEIAFFGGSFTGIPIEEQSAYLEIARDYKRRGLIHKIHMSTRPDYIDEQILDNLRNYEADIIELGVQSFDPQVLKLSNRGHDTETVHRSAALIKEYGFTLGIQLMIGLPGDSYEKCMASVAETIKIAPEIARLYPTVVLRDTALFEMARLGKYQPLTEKEAVSTTKEMYRALTEAGIQVIRVGLKSTDIINSDDGAIGAGSYHPAFRQLVEAEIAKEDLEKALSAMLSVEKPSVITFASHPESFSNMIGNRKSNRIYFENKYPQPSFRFKTDRKLPAGKYIIAEPETRS